MSHNAHPMVQRADTWSASVSNALVWVLFAAAGLLLAWFIAVLNDITERGEKRRIQQRTTGSLILADELRGQGGIERVLTASTDSPLR